MNRKFLTVAGISGALAVSLGAFAAHGLKSVLSEENLSVFHTAVQYHFLHTLALLAVGIISFHVHSKWLSVAGWLFIAGIIFFSGSLYLLSINESLRWMGAITPIGGLCFIAGWISLAVAALPSR